MTDAQLTPRVDTIWARLVATLFPLLPQAKDELFLAVIHNDLNDLERELTDATTALADARRALEEKTEESASAQRVVSDLQEQYLVLRDERDAESARLRADLAAAFAENTALTEQNEQYRLKNIEVSREISQMAVDLAAARAEWQDIATAPKDGTHVLINDGYSIAVAFWGESSVFVKEADAWCVGDCTGEYNIHQTISAPTHWRPLPTAPWRASLNL